LDSSSVALSDTTDRCAGRHRHRLVDIAGLNIVDQVDLGGTSLPSKLVMMSPTLIPALSARGPGATGDERAGVLSRS